MVVSELHSRATVQKIIGTILPAGLDLDMFISGNRQETSLEIHHILDAPCSNFSPLGGATELCMLKHPDTRAVLSTGHHSGEQ